MVKVLLNSLQGDPGSERLSDLVKAICAGTRTWPLDSLVLTTL